MIINRYIIAALIVMLLVFMSYVVNFYFLLKYQISNDTAVWGQLGDYVGGLLNPILTFLSLVLLIKSLNLQNDANRSLREELKNSKKTEKLRSFEAQFFNMINSQRLSFDSFKIEFNLKGKRYVKNNIEAVIEIENEIETMRESYADDADVSKFLKTIDDKDKIFGASRVFYIMVKMISDKLSEENGFSEEDRKSHLLTLINFTDFSFLRLMMICMQFTDYQSVEYLKSDQEFAAVIDEVGLSWDLY